MSVKNLLQSAIWRSKDTLFKQCGSLISQDDCPLYGLPLHSLTSIVFFSFLAQKIVEESDRRSHGKSQRHKNSKERKRRWSCEDCHEYFNDESALMSHLSSNRHCKQVLLSPVTPDEWCHQFEFDACIDALKKLRN